MSSASSGFTKPRPASPPGGTRTTSPSWRRRPVPSRSPASGRWTCSGPAQRGPPKTTPPSSSSGSATSTRNYRKLAPLMVRGRPGTDNATLGQPLAVVPRPGRKPGQLLHARQPERDGAIRCGRRLTVETAGAVGRPRQIASVPARAAAKRSPMRDQSSTSTTPRDNRDVGSGISGSRRAPRRRCRTARVCRPSAANPGSADDASDSFPSRSTSTIAQPEPNTLAPALPNAAFSASTEPKLLLRVDRPIRAMRTFVHAQASDGHVRGRSMSKS